jgi:uncharacterized protein YfaS (alpha-2-macroglobulin family)
MFPRRSLGFFLALGGCWPSTTPTPSDPGTPQGEQATVVSEADVAAQAEVPTAAAVRIRDVGPYKVGTTRIAVHTRPDLFPQDAVGGALPAGTEIVIAPPVEGAWTVTDRDTLEFRPASGFAPNTAYVVTMKSLNDGTKAWEAEPGWTHSFKTPEFAFARLALRTHDIERGTAEVDLLFTGAVDATEVAARTKWEVNGNAVTPVAVREGSEPHELVAVFSGRDLRTEGKLVAHVGAGVPWRGDKKVVTAASKAEIELKPGAAIEIFAAKVREGTSGFYVDIVCRDRAVTGTRYYWDRVDYSDYEVSTRCLLDEAELLDSVNVDPPVELTIASAPGGFRLFGDFERGAYKLHIDAGATSVDGGVLKTAYEADLEVPRRTPTVSFASRGRYLPRDAWKNLAIEHRNVDLIDVEIRHVPEENLVFWMNGYESAGSATSNLVVDKTLKIKNTPDQDLTSWVDVASLLPDAERGIYEVTLRAKEKIEEAPEPEAEDHDTGYRRHEAQPEVQDGYRIAATATSRLLLTDMHVIAKLASPGEGESYAPKVSVWTLGVHDNRPVGGVDVKLVRPSGYVMARCRTDLAGGCEMDVAQDAVDKTGPLALIASKGDDLTYVRFSDLQVATEADTSGDPWYDSTAYKASVYLDRGVYRPGDTAHVSAIVRERDHTAPDAGMPVVLRVFDPQNKELKKRVLSTNAAGMISSDVDFADFATTGRYRAALEVGDRNVGSVSFSVEEFVPERMRVDVTGDEKGVLAEAEAPFDISARWLFGGSAEGSRVDVTCQVRPSVFAPAAWKSHRFGLSGFDSELHPVLLGNVAGEIADDGTARVSCPAAAKGGGYMGASELVAQVAVFEGESGRSTQGTATVPVHPEKHYVGLSIDGFELSQQGGTKVEGVLVDWNGAVVPNAAKEVQVEIFRVTREYGWMWDVEQNTSVYRRMHRKTREYQTKPAVADGKFAFEFEPADRSEDYLVVATAGNARTEVFVQGTYSYGWWWYDEYGSYGGGGDETPRAQRPTELALDAAQNVALGEAFTVKTVAPWSGKMLVALETDQVVTYQWKDVVEGPVEWSFTVEEFVPNAYVTALLIKDPHAESADAFMPDRAFGARSVKVLPKQFTHALTLTAPSEVKPNSKLEVDLDLGATSEPTFVTVAAVDEGILSLTKFRSPDPFEDIFRKRMLGVSSYETVGWTLMLPPGGPAGHTGGDEAGAGGRVQMVKPVALWSGVVEVPASGKAKVSFDVPGYRGELRVMAVSASETKMGHTDARVTVRDPLTLQTTLPRFLVDDDAAEIPVTLTNLSGKAREAVVTIAATELEALHRGMVVGAKEQDPPVTFPDGAKQTVKLAVGETKTIVFKAVATRAPAAVKFRVDAKAGELASYEELDMPIETTRPEARITRRVTLNQGDNDLRPLLADWLPGSDRTTFWVTTNPYGPAMAHLKYLVRYPYGCIEQTSSSTRPLLFVGTLLDDVDPEFKKDAKIDKMVSSGIERILGMQTPSGGFAYWPGGTEPTGWGTIYATHVLLDAKKAGYDVPQTAIDDAMSWMDRQVSLGHGDHGWHSDAYAHYVLALGGKARTAQAQKLLNELSSDTSTQGAEDRYLLMAALYLGGDRRYEQDLKKVDVSPIKDERLNDWTFYSDLRRRGLVLSTFVDLFGQDAKGAALADLVGESLGRQSSSYYATQELVWGVTGLGKWVGKGDAAKIDKASLVLNGESLKTSADGKDKQDALTWSVGRASIANDLTLNVSKTGDRPVYLVMSTEGIRRVDDLAYGAQGLQVSREIRNAAGQLASLYDIELGQQLYVQVRVKNTTRNYVQNIAVVDRMPAGFEIENSRLGRGLMPEWSSEEELWGADHMNLRDDRVEVFGGLAGGQEASIVYVVRAVTAGTFQQPEVRAEAMYDPKLWARQRGDTVRIHAPWDEQAANE